MALITLNGQLKKEDELRLKKERKPFNIQEEYFVRFPVSTSKRSGTTIIEIRNILISTFPVHIRDSPRTLLTMTTGTWFEFQEPRNARRSEMDALATKSAQLSRLDT